MRIPGGVSCAAFAAVLVSLAACGGGNDGAIPDTPEPTEPGGGSVSIAWGPRLPESGLSALIGAGDDFGPEVADALARAAVTTPNGASQSSQADDDGRTSDEVSVRVVRDDDGILVHEVTHMARLFVRVPGPPRQGLAVALFTTLQPGVEPDLSSYPHEVLGVWASDDEAAAFWTMSPAIPEVAFDARSPTGTATYEGDAAGLHASSGSVTTFLADVAMEADFDSRTVSGTVDSFRGIEGASLGALAVALGETGFSPQGGAFAGATSGAAGTEGVPGSGQWGARWSDGLGWTMGGTFGFAADDDSVAVLGAFTACSCASASNGDPDDPVSTSP